MLILALALHPPLNAQRAIELCRAQMRLDGDVALLEVQTLLLVHPTRALERVSRLRIVRSGSGSQLQNRLRCER
jgi:hypothetical protein